LELDQFAALAVSLSGITLLTGIDDSVTTSVDGAVSSAGIRKCVAVEHTVIALFTNFDSAITTIANCSGVDWGDSSSSGRSDEGISAKQTLSGSVVFENDTGEEFQLLEGQGSGSGDHEPVDILGARGSGFRTLVMVGTNNRVGVAGEVLKIDLGVGQCLTTNVQGTERRATIDSSVRVGSTSVAFFTETGLNDTVTAKRHCARSSATKNSARGRVTLFVRVSHTIAASMSLAVRSTSIWQSGTVGSTIVASLVSLFDSVTTVASAARASIIIDIIFVVTLFSVVNNTIATEGFLAIGSASIGLSIVVFGSIVTLFTTKVVHNTVTTKVQLAIHTTSVWSAVAVAVIDSSRKFGGVTIIASLVNINESISAAEGAITEAENSFDTGRVAIFTSINNAITTRWWSARCDRIPGSARSIWGKRIERSIVA